MSSIRVWNCRAAVCRWAPSGANSQRCEMASNWEQLEKQALQALECQGGAMNLSGLYFCPPQLAEQAEFGEAECTP